MAQSRKGIPSGLTADLIRDAASEIRSHGHNFGESTKYHVIIDDQLYSPKAIVGVASQLLTGEAYEPRDFSGGSSSSQANAVLESLGFKILPKSESADSSAQRYFGDIPGVVVGTAFADRKALAAARIHRPLVAGISGSAQEGADSIVMSGGYEDDEDLGDTVIYTGHGGNDSSTGKQVGDQRWTRGNLAMRRSQTEGLPIRVVRGHNLDSKFAPDSGYRYDGLYFVDDSWRSSGVGGFQVCRFRLVRADESLAPWQDRDTQQNTGVSPRSLSTVQRIVRSSSVVRSIKQMYKFSCQICAGTLIGPTGPYAEGAHIKPLGKPHNGPDIPENVLCLCPNCHVLFDIGGIAVEANLDVIDHLGESFAGRRLRTAPDHKINPEFLAYHRSTHAIDVDS